MKAVLSGMRPIGGMTMIAALLVAAGCSTIEPRDADIAARAAAARTRAQHLEVASMYDERAGEEGVASEKHRVWAEQERRTSELLNQGRPTRWAPSIMRQHCEMLESAHAKAAADSAALAQRHRRMAAEAAP